MDKIVAQRLWIDRSSIVEVKRRLIEASLIDKTWQPIAWEKRQKRSDHDASGAERQRRFREKNKRNALRNASSNVTVTPPDKIREDKNIKTCLVQPKNKLNPAKIKAGIKQDEAEEIFNFWKLTLDHSRARLSASRVKLINRWLKEYAKQDLLDAIKGCSLTPHNMGDNPQGQRYDSLELILRDVEHIDRFIRNCEHPPKPRIKSFGQYQPTPPAPRTPTPIRST
jgi:hypothetical protein